MEVQKRQVDIYAWIHSIIEGVGGLHDFESHEVATPNIPRDEAVAAWVIMCLANPKGEEAKEVLAAIMAKRRGKKQ